jgi:DNA polymerase IV
MERFIVHVDMDAFFASIEQRDDPALKGKPVVVGADPKNGRGRGVVSTCSYEARKFGIHSAMPVSQAFALCPQAVFVPPDIEKYSQASRDAYKIFYEFTPQLEPVGIDEAFLDITKSFHLFGTPENACRELKKRIKEKILVTASAGLAPNKFLAKIASDLNKPDGFTEIRPEDISTVIWPLSVGKISGIGKKSEAFLNARGIKTIGDLARADIKALREWFGSCADNLHALANGHDASEVTYGGEAKSVSNETTFENDLFDKEKVMAALLELSDKVSMRLREYGFKGRTITLKLRFSDFTTYARSITIEKPTNFCDNIFSLIKELYNAFSVSLKPVRLVGVKVSNLNCDGGQIYLFDKEADEKKEKKHVAVARIRSKFGEDAIVRAKTIGEVRR